MKQYKALIAVACAAAVFTAGHAGARELVYGAWVSPKHGIMKDALPYLFKGVAKDTNGEITWKLVAGGALVKGNTTLAGLRDGLIDAGLGISVFTMKNTPSTALIHSTLLPGDDAVATTGAQNETVLLHCPSCLKEWKENNTLYLSGYGTTPFRYICRDKVESVADFKGLKVRATGGGVHITKLAGAVPVNMTPAEATTALQRGTLDCVLGAISWLKTYSYQDVAKYVVSTPMGMIGPAVSMAMNYKTWKSLTKEQRAAHWKYLPLVVAHSAISSYILADNKILDDAKSVGVTITKGTGFQAVMDKRVELQRQINIDRFSKFGVKDPGAILDAYDKAMVKWQKISKEVGLDVDKYAAAIKREIYDKLDPEDM